MISVPTNRKNRVGRGIEKEYCSDLRTVEIQLTGGKKIKLQESDTRESQRQRAGWADKKGPGLKGKAHPAQKVHEKPVIVQEKSCPIALGSTEVAGGQRQRFGWRGKGTSAERKQEGK